MDCSVMLEPITDANYEAVFDLDVADNQRGFITANVRSVAQAYVYDGAEPFAIRAGRTIVGFTTLFSDPKDECPRSLSIVRIMIDRDHQRRGYGRSAMQAIIDLARSRPGLSTIQLSVYPDNEAAIRLYESIGFVDTGELAAGEKVYRMELS